MSSELEFDPLVDQILIVDDEVNILKALERVLRPDGYRILKASGGNEALDILNNEYISTIICDLHMPDLSGIDVMASAVKLRPDTTRIILTGERDIKAAATAINIGRIWQFVQKPWEETALRQTVKGAVEKHRLLTQNHRLQSKIQAQHRALEISHQNLKSELQLGAKIQEVLLFGKVPQHPDLEINTSSRGSKDLDGDFFEFFQPSPSCIDFVIGDVMGKGVPAALLGCAVKTELQRFALPFQKPIVSSQSGFWKDDLLSPAEILERLQSNLAHKLQELNYFVSLFYGRYDVNRQTLQFVDLGFPRPILYKKGDGRCEYLSGHNLPLGILEKEEYKQETVHLFPGDLLLLYSDGLSEAKSPQGQMFGPQRLMDLVRLNNQSSTRSLVHLTEQAVFAFAGPEGIDDDLTLMAIRVGTQSALKNGNRKKTTTFQSCLSELEEVRAFIGRLAEDCPGHTETMVGQLQLAANEAFCNIVEHGVGNKQAGIIIEGEPLSSGIFIQISDQGEPFDPSAVKEPNFAGGISGGFGLYLLREIADELRYIPRTSPGAWNHLQITKYYKTEKANMDLSHKLDREDNVLVISLQGENLDANEAPQFKEKVKSLIANKNVHSVVLDLNHLQFIDSSGLGCFLSILRHLNNQGGDLKLASMKDPIKAMFEVVRMHKLFEIFNSADDAVRSFD